MLSYWKYDLLLKFLNKKEDESMWGAPLKSGELGPSTPWHLCQRKKGPRRPQRGPGVGYTGSGMSELHLNDFLRERESRTLEPGLFHL